MRRTPVGRWLRVRLEQMRRKRAAKLLEYRFVGRCLAKCLFDDHTCLEAAPNVKLLKFVVGEPFTFDDLQLVDEELRALRGARDRGQWLQARAGPGSRGDGLASLAPAPS